MKQGTPRQFFSKLEVFHIFSLKLEISKWRPKIGATNKLIFNIKALLNPKLKKETVVDIQDSLDEEYLRKHKVEKI